jgi:predicted AAA+ superfamily ATPase
MFRFVLETFHRLIAELPPMATRYLYPQFHLRNRLTGLIGPRGVGKTTLLLQYIKNELIKEKNSFYFSADLVYFQKLNRLEFVSDLHRKEGYKIIFIDEIHKYQGLNQELKNIYDSFPSLKIVFSGSSMLDLVAGSHDLSRREKLYRLHGLSFREYLNFSQNLNLQPCSFQELMQGIAPPEIPKILTSFQTYLAQGYYPFVFEDPHSYHEKVSRVIEKTIFEDIANYYNLKTLNLHYFKKILTYLASIPPGELNAHNLSQNLGVDHKTAQHYLSILVSVGLIRELHIYEGGGAGLRKASKFLLNNPILKGTERELFFIQSLQNAEVPVFFSEKADYRTRDEIFEIGGRSKTRRQLKGANLPAYLLKDDILHPLQNEIPLFQCGFLY